MTAALSISVEPGGALYRSVSRANGVVELWFGRDEACEVLLPSTRVSRQHLFLRYGADQISLRDQSSNGSTIAGRKLRGESMVLSAQEKQFEIEIEPYRLTVRVHAAEPVAEPPAGPPSVEPADKALRREIHRRLLDHLDLSCMEPDKLAADDLRARVEAALRRIIADRLAGTPARAERLVQELANEALGLGPLEELLADPEVSEIMVVDPSTVYAERGGRLELTEHRFTDDESVRAVIERIVTPLGRRSDESNPLVDARLKDGSRVNAVIPPLAVKGPCITIRKFPKHGLSIEQLVGFGTLDEAMARFLERSVRCKKNILISGGTGSGKTTLLNVLSGAIPESERVVTVEDAAELKLGQSHVVSLESRPENLEGKGAFTIRDLVKNALRMRPDRIVVGECRGAEALDMLQAMNTGHDGSMTTTHANTAQEAVGRIETLCLMAGVELPIRAIRAQLASSIDLVVQQTRFGDGSRRITQITEVCGVDSSGEVLCRDIFGFYRGDNTADGQICGEFASTGFLPSFIDEFVAAGFADHGDSL